MWEMFTILNMCKFRIHFYKMGKNFNSLALEFFFHEKVGIKIANIRV